MTKLINDALVVAYAKENPHLQVLSRASSAISTLHAIELLLPRDNDAVLELVQRMISDLQDIETKLLNSPVKAQDVPG